MGLVRGSRWVVGGGLAALLYAGFADHDPDVKTALARLDVLDVRASLAHFDAAPASADLSAVHPDSDATDATTAVEKIVLANPDADVSAAKAADECLLAKDCVDQYLWVVYERAAKVDTIKVSDRIKVTVKTKGKTKTVTKTVTKLVDEDFTWKDPKAADKASMSMKDYVIGGMDRAFKTKLYRLCRALDDAGFVPGMTSGFRDDYRQSIASGNRAAMNRSYHGGSLRGGYGHGLAADVVSMRGATRSERAASSEILWKWIDKHGSEFGIGRPYLDRDPPHIAPIDGQEYADKRGLKPKQAGLLNKDAPRQAPAAAPE